MTQSVSITYYVRPSRYKDIMFVTAFQVRKNRRRDMFTHYGKTVLPFETGLYICDHPHACNVAFFESDDIIEKDVMKDERVELIQPALEADIEDVIDYLRRVFNDSYIRGQRSHLTS